MIGPIPHAIESTSGQNARRHNTNTPAVSGTVGSSEIHRGPKEIKVIGHEESPAQCISAATANMTEK
jgi:hypothetical protein